MLRRELELFDPELAAKPQIVAANKIDAVVDEDARGRARPRAPRSSACPSSAFPASPAQACPPCSKRRGGTSARWLRATRRAPSGRIRGRRMAR